MKEARELREDLNRLKEIGKLPITARDVDDEEAKDNAFSYQGWSSEDLHFNVALRRLQKTVYSIQQRTAQFEGQLKDVHLALKALKEVGQGTHSQLLTLQIAENYTLSHLVRTRLETFLRSISVADSTSAPQTEDAVPTAMTLGTVLEDLRRLHRPLDGQYRKVDRAITALQDLVEAETRFSEVASQCSVAYQTLAQKADVGYFQTRLGEHGQARELVVEEYSRLASELAEHDFDTITDQTTINKVRHEIEQLSERTQAIVENLRRVWNDYANESNHFIGSVHQMIQLVKRQDLSLRTNEIEADCEELVKALAEYEWPDKSISSYEAIKANIRKTTMELLGKTLDETERNVLLVV